MQLNSGQKIIATVSLLSLIALLIISLVIIPTVASIKKTTNDTYQLRVYMEQKYQESLRSRLTKSKIEAIKKESNEYGIYLFSKTDALALIQHLEKMSKESKIDQKINSTNLDQIVSGKKVEISTTISGEYNDVLEYINTIENTKYFFNIESVRIIPNYDGSGSVSKNATAYLNLGLYVSK